MSSLQDEKIISYGSLPVVRVLHIEDDYIDAAIFEGLVNNVTHVEVYITRVKRLAEAIEAFADAEFDLIVSDLMLPDSEGLQTLYNLNKLAKDIPIIALTGSQNNDISDQAIYAGADDYLVKGNVDQYLLGRVIRYAIDRKNIQLEVEKLAQIDPLTSLLNRHAFESKLQESIKKTNSADCDIAIMFLDLDFFKLINDDYGHQAGDFVLKRISQRIIDSIRLDDYAARVGGDEFVIVLENVSSQEIVESVATRMLKDLQKEIVFEEAEISVTASIGICVYDGEAEVTVDDLLGRADSAMYLSKNHGRNKATCSQPKILPLKNASFAQKNNLVQLHANLRQALSNREFILHYQPQLDARTGEVVGAEALLRWEHPEEGLIPPGKFINILETSGQIVSVGLWVLETACKQWSSWIQEGVVKADSKISVNLSPRQCGQEAFATKLAEILADSGLPASLLNLELTEGILLENSESSIKLMHKLKEMGVNISLDDFGTGFSSLSYLTQMPIDSLKIDRSFVAGILQDKTSEAIAISIIGLAKTLGMNVVVEGVEEEKQVSFLQSYGCDIFQGFYYSKPIPKHEFSKFNYV